MRVVDTEGSGSLRYVLAGVISGVVIIIIIVVITVIVVVVLCRLYRSNSDSGTAVVIRLLRKIYSFVATKHCLCISSDEAAGTGRLLHANFPLQRRNAATLWGETPNKRRLTRISP